MMPGRRFFTLVAVLFLVPAAVRAQTVTVRGGVSKTVAISIAPDFAPPKIDVAVVKSGNSVRLTLSNWDAGSPVIRVPLLVRSNCGFNISAVFQSTTAELGQISVTDVHPTGSLVSRNIRNALDVARNVSGPLLSGPRISLGGTLESPNNALEVTVLIRLKSQSVPGSTVQLTFVATPE